MKAAAAVYGNFCSGCDADQFDIQSDNRGGVCLQRSCRVRRHGCTLGDHTVARPNVRHGKYSGPQQTVLETSRPNAPSYCAAVFVLLFCCFVVLFLEACLTDSNNFD